MSQANAERRVRKFVSRAERALETSLFTRGNDLFEMELVWERDPSTGSQRAIDLRMPSVTLDDLNSAIIVARPFFLGSEDAYLPKVVDAIVALSDSAHAEAIRANGLAEFVAQFVSDGRLVGGGFVQSGRLEMDNEAGAPGRLLSSGQIAMDYIYGVALHEDDDRLRRLSYTSGGDTILLATAQELHHLMKAVATIREQVRSSSDNGHFSIEITVGDPSPLAMISGTVKSAPQPEIGDAEVS